jgi:hypothetical protein
MDCLAGRGMVLVFVLNYVDGMTTEL